MSKSFALLLVLVFLTASCIIVAEPVLSSTDVVENSWVSMKPLPTARSNLGVGVVNGKIYAIGGYGGLDINEAYDPETDIWTTKKAMPTPRDGFAASGYGNKVYCFGGVIGNDIETGAIPTAVNEAYDPAADTWETKASMPTARMQLEANVVEGNIYLIGGLLGGYSMYGPSVSDRTEVYDPATNTWSTAAPIPTPVFSYASAVVDKKIYVIGGSGSSLSLAKVNLTQVFDTEKNQWTLGSPIPVAVKDAAAGATTGVNAPKKIYVIGGRTDGFGKSFNQVYNPDTESWTSAADMPTSRMSLAVAVADDMLYAVGGISMGLNPQATVYTLNEQYRSIGYEAEAQKPEPDSSLPVEYVYATAAVAATLTFASALLLLRKRKNSSKNVFQYLNISQANRNKPHLPPRRLLQLA